MSTPLDEPSLPPRPYPGLRPFEPAEWPIFFGRERMADATVASLLERRLVFVHGDSGAGKSSLIRAGVLPRLVQEQSQGTSRWRNAIVLPGGGPLRQLARVMAALDDRGADEARYLELRRVLNLGRGAAVELARLMLRDEHDHLCLLIDQFEELFEFERSPGGGPEARGFADWLVGLAHDKPRGLYVVVTMRSEWLGACARFAGLAEVVNAHQYLLPPMKVRDLVRAIREPVTLYGGSVDLALAERLAADAQGPDGLPLVQHALMLMHRHAEGPLTLAHYPADGLAAMLSRHADEVARTAQPAGRPRLVEDLMRALTGKNADGHAVRRQPRQTLAQLAAACGSDVATLRQVVDAMRADGVSFLTPRRAEGDDAPLPDDAGIDIGHEALIRCWDKLADPLKGWLETEFRNGLVWRSMLVQADSFRRDTRNVLSAATTAERSVWLKRRNPAWAERYGGRWADVAALIAASEVAEKQRLDEASRQEGARLKAEARARAGWLRFFVAGVVMLGAVVLAGWALYERDQAVAARRSADEQRDQAVAARRSADVALTEVNQVLDRLVEQALSGKGSGAPANGDVVQQLESAARTLSTSANVQPVQLPQQAAAASLPARVYIHIADESQRAAANRFAAALARRELGGEPIRAPGVELKEPRTQTVLRCFRPDECRDEAPQLLALANAIVRSPPLTLQDFSRFYKGREPRPRHYEIWFGSGALDVPGAAGDKR